MRPIIVTSPRTGSTLIVELLGNLAKQQYGYKNTLHEYFTIAHAYENHHIRKDDVVITLSLERVNRIWFTDREYEIEKRLELLNNEYCYMMKVFPMDMTTNVLEYIKNYDVIYLERKDKLRQLLSFLYMHRTNISHYKEGDKEVSQIVYYPNEVDMYFNTHFNPYYEYKRNNPSKFPVLYYEDFIEQGSNEQALINLLKLDIKEYIPYNIDTIPTPYKEEDLEKLIVNKSDWNKDRQRIIDALYKN